MKQFFKIDVNLSKKKLIAIFGAIVIVAVVILYLENIYNLSHRSKNLIQSSFNSLKNHDKPTTGQKEDKEDELNNDFEGNQSETDKQHDNQNNDNQTKCWHRESFTVVESCLKCDSYSRNSLKACQLTGYRQVINCEKYGLVSKSCPKPNTIILKEYWTFQICSLIIALGFTIVAKKRKRHLDQLATERVRKQILS